MKGSALKPRSVLPWSEAELCGDLTWSEAKPRNGVKWVELSSSRVVAWGDLRWPGVEERNAVDCCGLKPRSGGGGIGVPWSRD